jgi:cytidine deaminase
MPYIYNKLNVLKEAQFSYKYQVYNNLLELDVTQQALLLRAQSIINKAHAPYSNFKVGASVLTTDGVIFDGVNIENAAYPSGICAERSALSGLLSHHPDKTIQMIAISYVNSSNISDQPIYPCGMCRQFLLECEVKNNAPIQLISGGLYGEIHVLNSVKILLPFSFSNKSLA